MVLCLLDNAIEKRNQMEGNVSTLSTKEIEEQIRELEHTYAEFFEDEGDVGQLLYIRKSILEFQIELSK
jgi:hypothetical protein